MRENSSLYWKKIDIEYKGFEPNEPESYIALTMYQSEYIGYALDFASAFKMSLKNLLKENRGVKQVDFML